MSLTLYRRHTSKCSQGRSRHERSYESDELRRGFKKCQCPIQFEGKIKELGFVRKSTERISWEEAKRIACAWEATVAQPEPVSDPLPVSESRSASPKKDEPVTIERAATEFLADIEARRIDAAQVPNNAQAAPSLRR